MKTQWTVMIVGTVLFTMVITPQVHAASVVLSPSLLTIIQGESASSTVAVYGMPNSEYALTASGLYGEFDPAYVITDGNGYGTSVFTADSAAQAYSVFFGAPYCPGVHPFTVSAVSGGGLVADSGSASGTLTVTSAGPIQLAASTDKPTYTEGDEVTVGISLSRAAHGTITVTPPSGKASSYSFESTAVTPTVITKTFKVTSQYGGWTVSVQANDYCGLITSTSTSFTVNPMTYDVYVSIAGVSASTSAVLQVDGVSQGTVAGSQRRSISVSNGTHTISVDEYVPAGAAGVRFQCPQNDWSFNSTGSHTFNYQTQYQLSVQTDPTGIFPTVSRWFDPGVTTRTSSAPQTVEGQTPGVKYVFEYWEVDGVAESASAISFVMNGPHTAVAKYVTKYRLIVDSDNNLGNPQGSNYYNAGYVANFSVSTPVGILVQQVFVQWTGDYAGSTPIGSILMDRPHEVQAVWTTSYTQLISIIGIITITVTTLLILRGRHRSRIG